MTKFNKTTEILKAINKGQGMAIFALALPFTLLWDLGALIVSVFKK